MGKSKRYRDSKSQKQKPTKSPLQPSTDAKRIRNTFLENIEKKISVLSFLNGKYIIFILSAVFIYVFIMNAWICDDAYITFRTIDNFVNGFGLRWNINERVQSYTHPLWMLLITVFYFFTREPYFTTLVLSFMLCLASIYFLAFRIADNRFNAAAALGFLILSKGFIDYTSSGLENPLIYFLFAIFIYVYFNYKDDRKKLLLLSLIAGLSTLNRMDTILFLVPVLAYQFWRMKSLESFFTIIIGFIPFLVWELFSLVYYGFLFPNTAYAKLSTNIPAGELFVQGLRYIQNSFTNDPTTLIGILAISALAVVFGKKNRKLSLYLPLLLGILLYLIYIVRIGGDFMSGRFFAAPLFFAVLIFAHLKFENKKAYASLLLAFCLILSIVTLKSPLLSTPSYGSDRSVDKSKKGEYPWWFHPFTDKYGITDERAFYYSECGLIPVLSKGLGRPAHNMVEQGIKTRRSKFKTFLKSGIGMFSYYCGPKVRVFDYFALTDALIARLPNQENQKPRWRIGHFERDIPQGYFETVDSDSNQIWDQNLHKYYDKLKIVIKSDLFAPGRLAEIWNFNTGAYSDLIRSDFVKIVNRDFYMSSGDSVSVSKYYNNLGVFWANQNNNTEALKFYYQAYGYCPENKTLLNNMVGIWARFSLWDSSYYYAVKLVNLGKKPDDMDRLFVEWSKELRSRNKIDSAITVLENWLKLDPSSPIAFTNLGTFYINEGRKQEAVDLWKKALVKKPGFPQALANLLQYYLYDAKDYSAAALYASEMLKYRQQVDPRIIKFLEPYMK